MSSYRSSLGEQASSPRDVFSCARLCSGFDLARVAPRSRSTLIGPKCPPALLGVAQHQGPLLQWPHSVFSISVVMRRMTVSAAASHTACDCLPTSITLKHKDCHEYYCLAQQYSPHSCDPHVSRLWQSRLTSTRSESSSGRMVHRGAPPLLAQN